jgi:peptidoglycan hydrolase-like protein with peptidoglycan-binding domain
MARTGLAQIDALLAGQATQALSADICTTETVGFLQDLLIGQGLRGIPGPLGAARGRFGPRTTEAIREFQQARGLPVTGTVDVQTLRALVGPDWPKPIACCGYVSLVLDQDFSGMKRLVSITSQFEGAGLFAAMNRNTDKAGLSFGLIQWAQKPLRLNELLRTFQSREPAEFVRIFGGGDAARAQALIAHTGKKRGGTDDTGATTDPAFDLIAPPWDQRFIEAGKNQKLQRVQLDLAVETFTKSFTGLQTAAPQIRSERGIAFMLDVANQHGDGGARDILRTVQKPGMPEAELLVAVQEESVRRVRAQFGDGRPEVESTQNRRQAFRTTTLLSDDAVALA